VALAVEEAGADAISLINTLVGTAIDVKRRKPILANVTGGLSGPAIKPIAVRMVYQVASMVHIPVVGMGGIMTRDDALEFFFAGACAIQVGTAIFAQPQTPIRLIDELGEWLDRQGVASLSEIVGAALPTQRRPATEAAIVTEPAVAAG
jgi:dihydroorotate dehydrogenase (NAD+) catalytic subunit